MVLSSAKTDARRWAGRVSLTKVDSLAFRRTFRLHLAAFARWFGLVATFLKLYFHEPAFVRSLYGMLSAGDR
jgi:hypothetical protein